jgi:hypothetical protein
LISNRVVLRSFSRDDLFKSKWFFSYLLIFEIVEKSMSSTMNMRSWWNQIEMKTKLEDNLIRRKNLVTIEDFDSQKNLDKSWDEKSINEIVEREFLYHELIFSFRLNRQQLTIHSFRQSIKFDSYEFDKHLIFSLFRVFRWLIELSHLLFFASFILCCFINLRINTISKMFLIINSSISKTNLILKKLDDWDEWIMIIKTITRRDDVEKYVNLIKIESAEFIEFDFFIFFTIKLDAINSIELSIDEQRDLAILREDYKKKMRKYKKQIDALKNLNIFILTSVDRFNFIYLKNQKTIYQKLSALKKRLVLTNRIQKLEMMRKYKDLQKAFKHQ